MSICAPAGHLELEMNPDNEARLLLRLNGACHPLCTVLILIPAGSLVVLHKQYNNVGEVPG